MEFTLIMFVWIEYESIKPQKKKEKSSIFSDTSSTKIDDDHQ
jgi:hypothetical protein